MLAVFVLQSLQDSRQEDLNAFSEITTAYEVFNAETDKLTKQLALLKEENERIKALSNKIIIYTEGKTDVKYLKLAFEKLTISYSVCG